MILTLNNKFSSCFLTEINGTFSVIPNNLLMPQTFL